MHNWSELENILCDQNIAEDDQRALDDFFMALSFSKRQQMFGILLGFPEQLNLFINLLKKKKLLAQQFNKELSQEILEFESKIFEDLKNSI